MASPITRETGYCDCVYSIFEAHSHPVILLEEGAMRWMGLRTCPGEVRKTALLLLSHSSMHQRLNNSQNLDLLVRDDRFDTILASILATGFFERVEQKLSYRMNDPYTKQIPRLRDTPL